ncbi:quinolinate synthase NadA [Tichowtungia aerotolerans]|uniref:Quinolinate synthase n=1 Tax=Tichowtungia aerotolerans TaxID=2697043 RepID=A0A6P1M6X8_9BACT|nr:quinolinate synthase NadA [Tichowtungia aerotolerans]QHI70539.1 quinolinate synthase NadA [Tichowtungia aerotolerans]
MKTIEEQILELKKQHGAVILAHNYQLDEVQAIADFTGDSLELSRKAANLSEDVVVFCGVHFMAETAAILSPDKTILIPDPNAGCPMADMVTAEQLRAVKAEHPGAKVVCYVNSSAEVKAESDICCTSSNAVKVCESLGNEQIIFVPDRNLGSFVAEKLNRKIVLYNGFCPTHERIRDVDVIAMKQKYPGAVVMAHPECSKPVRDLADELLSTGQMCHYAQASEKTEFIVATELGINYRLRNENPGKKFYPANPDRAVCPNMKKITLEKVLWSLQGMKERVTVPPDIAERAVGCIQRMLEI